MNLDLSSLPMPIFIRSLAVMSDDELIRFSKKNSPYRMEQEPNGEILILTPVSTDGAFINSRINLELGIWARGDGRGQVADSSAGFRLPDGSVRSPDASWVSYTRWNALSPEEKRGFSPLCPEFVIELTSPSDRLKDVQKKMADEWVRNGVEVGWLIDPEARQVMIYRPGDGPEVLHDPTSVRGTGCVAGFELVMERVWGRA